MIQNKELYKIQEELNYRKTTVNQWRKANGFPLFLNGGVYLVPLTESEAAYYRGMPS